MVLHRALHKRGVHGAVEAYGEVLFMPGGDVRNWTNRFTQRLRARAVAAAPGHDYGKRPLHPHPHAKHLKQTIKAVWPKFRMFGNQNMRLYAAVGATAPYAYYVDQGTGVYNGGAAYEAKILPPWAPGSPSLYEASWRPGGRGDRVKKVWIKGQKGQFYFARALEQTFTNMRLREAQIASGPRITDAISIVSDLEAQFAGNTSLTDDGGARLQQWREWRDAAYNRGRGLGRDGGGTSRYRSGVRGRAAQVRRSQREAESARRKQARADRHKEYMKRRREAEKARRGDDMKSIRKPQKSRATRYMEQAQKAAKQEMAAWIMKHPGGRINGYTPEGFRWVYRGESGFKHWSIRTADLFIEAGEYSNTKGARKR